MLFREFLAEQLKSSDFRSAFEGERVGAEMELVLRDILEELKRLNRTLERMADVIVDGFMVVPLEDLAEELEGGERGEIGLDLVGEGHGDK